VVPLRKSGWWKVALGAAYVGLNVAVCLLMFLGPHMVISAPVWLFGFLGLLGPAHEQATADPTCPACGKYFETAADVKAAPARSVAVAKAA